MGRHLTLAERNHTTHGPASQRLMRKVSQIRAMGKLDVMHSLLVSEEYFEQLKNELGAEIRVMHAKHSRCFIFMDIIVREEKRFTGQFMMAYMDPQKTF